MNIGKKRLQVLPPKTASKIPKPSTSVRKTPSTTLAADEGKSTLIDILEKPVPIGILIDSFCAS